MTINGMAQGVANLLGLGRNSLYYNPFLKVFKDDGNTKILQGIVRGKPLMIARLGSSESTTLLNYLEIQEISTKRDLWNRFLQRGRQFHTTWDSNICLRLCKNAGFFPNETEQIEAFCSLYLARMSDCDIAGYFQFVPGESYLWKLTSPNVLLIPASSLDPYLYEAPWSAALAGKRVLVIHPFAESIAQQFANNRTKLFENPLVLPEFELKTLKAVQAIQQQQTDYKTWFDALDFMQDEMAKIDFDVCIIGAGAFGLPLAAYAKSLGKIGIQMGGATQILFGIRGRRWEVYIPEVAKLFNEHWVRPLPSERPKEYASLELDGGAYW